VDLTPSEPLLTVAIPTYNGAAHLGEALRSITSQSDVAFELIVCDDRSEDATLELVRAAAGDRARVEVNSERLGLAGNWNRCVALSTTPFVAIFHQDDVMLPGHLAAHLASLGGDERIGLAASASDVIDGRGEPIAASVVDPGGLGRSDRLLEPGKLAAETVRGNPLRCSAVTLRRAAFMQAGGFDSSYRYVLDWEFWLRVSRSWRVAWLSRPSVRVRWHLASETQRFKVGTADLDETARLLDQLCSLDLKDAPDRACLESAAQNRLGRAFLNRAHEALRAGRTELARDCLRRGFGHAPGLIKTVLSDPRLCVQMAALAIAPTLAGRLFAVR
jgi:glycosyltransferase involved in cell wall biosynthesis